MCNHDCCAVKTAVQRKRVQQLLAKKKADELAKPRHCIVTPQTLIFPYEDCEYMANYIIRRTQCKPKFGLVLGLNLDNITEAIEQPIIISYGDIPKFPAFYNRESHGHLYVGQVSGVTVMAMHGRYLAYEGHQLATCSMPVRVMKLCGVEHVLLTCAAGAVNDGYNVGDVVLIKDHINLVGMLKSSPLHGPADKRFGTCNRSMVNAYDAQLLRKGLEIGQEIGYDQHMHTGVYACLGGPAYDTIAEEKLLRRLGVDVLGMALAYEVIVARHCDMKVFAFALVTVPSFKKLKYANLPLESGQEVCSELVKRMVYYVHNQLIETPGNVEKLLQQPTGYADQAFRTMPNSS